MSRSELHDWEYHFERCCKEMKEIAENIYDTAYARGANSKEPKTDILDKIRAEIAEEKIGHDLDIGNETLYNNAIDDCLKIIDKYR